MNVFIASTGGRAPPSQNTPDAFFRISFALAQLADLTAEPGKLLLLGARGTRAHAVVALGLAHPVAQRLTGTTDLRRDRPDRGPLRPVLVTIVVMAPVSQEVEPP